MALPQASLGDTLGRGLDLELPKASGHASKEEAAEGWVEFGQGRAAVRVAAAGGLALAALQVRPHPAPPGHPTRQELPHTASPYLTGLPNPEHTSGRLGLKVLVKGLRGGAGAGRPRVRLCGEQRRILTALTLAEPPRFQDFTLPDTE